MNVKKGIAGIVVLVFAGLAAYQIFHPDIQPDNLVVAIALVLLGASALTVFGKERVHDAIDLIRNVRRGD